MALTRAQVITGDSKKKESFSDFLNSFAKTPFGNQLGKVSEEKSVNQSLKNLILTNLGERIFQPTIGSGVRALLFENDSFIIHQNLKYHIENTIKNNEPRVNVLDIIVNENITDDNSLEVTIVYHLINNANIINLNLILRRVR